VISIKSGTWGFYYILKELSKVFCTVQDNNFKLLLDKEVLLVITKLKDVNGTRNYIKHLDSTKIKTVNFLDSLIKRLDSLKFKAGGNVRDFSTAFNHNKDVKLLVTEPKLKPKLNKDVKLLVTEPKLKPKLKFNSFEKILINGLVFYKSEDGLRIDCSTVIEYSSEIEYKKVYNSIQQVLQDFQKTDSKGFLNITDLNHFPVISHLIKHFIVKTDKGSEEAYIRGNKASEAYK